MDNYDENGFLRREKIKLPFDVILLAYMWEVFSDLRYVLHLFPHRDFPLGMYLCRMDFFLSETLIANIKQDLKKRFNYNFTQEEHDNYADYHDNADYVFEDIHMIHDLYKEEIAERLKDK